MMDVALKSVQLIEKDIGERCDFDEFWDSIPCYNKSNIRQTWAKIVRNQIKQNEKLKNTKA